MRPVRFVALAEDGQSLILTDEVGRMLSLTLDESVLSALRHKHDIGGKLAFDVEASLTPRDIQARIRAGDSVAEVARVANVPVEKVLRFAGPVLQERAAIVQFAHRNCSTSTPGENFGELSAIRLTEHGVDPQSVNWDSHRRDNGAWRIRASWQSGRATAHAVWDLDKSRMRVKPIDDMAHFLCDPPLTEDDDAVAQAGATSRDVQDGHVRGRPHVAASRAYSDDREAGEYDGPVVPALSMLRRTRDRGGGDRDGAADSNGTQPPAARVRPDERKPSGPEVEVEPARERVSAQRTAVGSGSVTDGRGAAAALGIGPVPPASSRDQRTRGRKLPSWDDILFGTSRE